MGTLNRPTRVLLIEADQDNYLLIRDALSKIPGETYRMDRVTDHDAARDALLRGSYDICLLGLFPGSGNDVEMVHEMRQACPNASIIWIIDGSDTPAGVESISTGAADFLPRDAIDAGSLRRSMRHAMERMASKAPRDDSRGGMGSRTWGHAEGLFKGAETAAEIQLFMQATLNTLSACIAILDERGFILCANASWKSLPQFGGLVEASSEGSNYLDLIHRIERRQADEVSLTLARVRVVIGGTRDGFELDYSSRFLVEEQWFRVRAARIGGFRPVRVVVAYEEISGRKRAEERLRESEERFREIAENIREVFTWPCRLA